LGGEAHWLDAELDAERLTRTLAIARSWLELREAEQHSLGANAELENEQHFVELVSTLVAAGELTAADRAAAEVRAIDARVRSQMAEGALVDARSAVVSELGPAAEGEYLTDGAMPEVAPPSAQALERLVSAATELPLVRARRLLARGEVLRADEEKAMRGMRVTLGVEARRDALTAVVVQGTLSSTLQVFGVGDREFAARLASARRLEGEAADEQTRARAMVAVAVHEVEHTREVFDVLVTRLVPATEQAVSQRERQLVAGEATLLDVLDARRQRFEAKWRVVQATREKVWALIRLRSLMHAAEVST
jgi:outer membrane protein TolC